MIGEIAVVPQIDGPGGDVIAAMVREIAAQRLRYQIGPTGTAVEGELDAILEAVRAVEGRMRALERAACAHRVAAAAGAPR